MLSIAPLPKVQKHCSCCGGDIIRWKGYEKQYPDNEGCQCKRCHITQLREYVLEIEKGKALIRESLNASNKEKFDAMPSWRKKYIVWQMWDEKKIIWKVGTKKQVA